MTTKKYMDIKEFRSMGLLQEVNRNFFHPMGLALEISINKDGSTIISGIQDYRNDPEGMIFNEGSIDKEKINNVKRLWRSKLLARRKLFQSNKVIQQLNTVIFHTDVSDDDINNNEIGC